MGERISKQLLVRSSISSEKQCFNNCQPQRTCSDGANLFRWGKATDPLCPLCKTCLPTNKHVISNCSSPVALERYHGRHDDVLTILVEAIIQESKPYLKVFAKLNDHQYNQLSSLFNSLRPDIAILGQNSVDTLELTICHKTNLEKSKQYRTTKYANLHADMKTDYSDL